LPTHLSIPQSGKGSVAAAIARASAVAKANGRVVCSRKACHCSTLFLCSPKFCIPAYAPISSPAQNNCPNPSGSGRKLASTAIANAISEAKAKAGNSALAQSIANAEASGCNSNALANVGGLLWCH